MMYSNSSQGCCAEDNRTLTERLFEGKTGTIFTCKILSFESHEWSNGVLQVASDGSIDADATAEIIEVYFGKVDTTVVKLKPGGFLKVGETYLLYPAGNGRVFGFGGNCDRWSKQVSKQTKEELRILKEFKDIFKNKSSGDFTFKMSNGAVISKGSYKKGKPIKTWEHFYETGIIKSKYDIVSNVTTQYFPNGFPQYKSTVKNKNSSIFEKYSNKVSGIPTYKEFRTNNDTGFVCQFTEFYEDGGIKILYTQAYVNLQGGGCTGRGYVGDYKEYFQSGEIKLSGQYSKGQKIGLWKWYNQDGTLKTEYDFKDGSGNQ